MASSGPRYPGTVASLANSGTSENAEAWVSPANAGADDGTETTITAATYDSPDISQILVCSNFGFTIPAGATINGITVEIDRRNSAGAASDNRVQLATGTTFATLVGANKADTATDWPTTTAAVSYGGAADTWTAGLTAAQVNAAGFAVFLSVQADAANTDIQVDYVRVTITYTETNVTATPGTAALTITAQTPTVTASDHKTVTPGTAALTLTPNAPVVISWPFSDGFESGDLRYWDVQVPGDGSLTVEAAAAYTGSYGLAISESAVAAGGVYVRRSFAATDMIRATGRFRSPTEGAAGNNNANLRIFAGGVRIVDVYRQNSTGGMWLRTRNNAGTNVFTDTGQTRSTATWYEWDVTVVYNGVGAVSRIVVKLDGTTYIDASTFDLDSGAYDQVQLGAEHPSQYVDIDVDSVYADRTPSLNVVATPATASLTLTAFAPVVTVPSPQTITPGTAALSLTAQTPVVTASDHKSVTPGTASLALTAQAPSVTVSDHQTVTPGTASLTIAPQAPTVSTSDHQTVTPGVASLTLSSFAPVVTGGAGTTVTPGAASLALSPLAPTVTATSHQSVIPGTATLTLTAFAPVVTAGAGLTVVPGTAALSMTAFAPDVVLSDHQLVTPGTASLVLTPQTPTVSTGGPLEVTPGTASLTLTPFAPTVSNVAVIVGGAPPRIRTISSI